MNESIPKQISPDETPPVFRSWLAWYLVVIGNLGLLIFFFTLFSWIFR